MNIREFIATDEAYEILAQLSNIIYPEHPEDVAALRREDDRRDSQFLRKRVFIEKEDRIIGWGSYGHLYWTHHPQRYSFAISILPDERCQGFGGAAYDHIVQVLASHNANELHAFVSKRHPDAIRFIEKRGFEVSLRESESRLATIDFDFARFDCVEKRVQSAGIEIKTYRELMDAPDHTRKLYDLEMLLERDVPSPRKPTDIPYEMWLKYRTVDNPEFLPDAYYIAVQNGQYIGMSSIEASQATPHLYTGLTGVHRDYRRKGIALAMKLRSFHYAKHLGNRTLITWNEENNPMLDINLKLGFVKQPAEVQYIKRL